MDDVKKVLNNGAVSRRRLLQTLGISAASVPFISKLMPTLDAQGRCIRAYGTPACNTDPIPEVFESTGWRCIGLHSLNWDVAEPETEAAWYEAFMGWKTRSVAADKVVIDMWKDGTSTFNKVPDANFPQPAPPAGGGRGGNQGPPIRVRAKVTGFAFDIDGWTTDAAVKAELDKRGLNPVADNQGDWHSFHVKDPDGFNVWIGNGKGYTAARKKGLGGGKLSVPLPFPRTSWTTVWLDHFSFGASNYKKSVSWYKNLLGWMPTYDEGSQNEVMIGDIGNTIIRGGNPLDPAFGQGGGRAGGTIDHISFGVTPWDNEKVSNETKERKMPISTDTSDGAPIETAQFKSYHTRSAMQYNVQYSYNTHDTRLNLAISVNPRRPNINMPRTPPQQ